MHHNARPHRRTARRFRTAVTALAVSGATLAVTATAASAWSLPFVCSGAAEANACLSGHTPGNHMVQIHVGIDVYMSRQDAEAIIAQSGNAFSAAMWGDDYRYDNRLTSLTLTWEAAWDGGISAEFDALVPAALLDEDSSWFDNRDELFARVSLYDARYGTTRDFDTPQWSIYADAQ